VKNCEVPLLISRSQSLEILHLLAINSEILKLMALKPLDQLMPLE